MFHASPVPKETCVNQHVGLCSTPILHPRRLVYISLWACAPHQSCTQGDLCISACGLVLHTSPAPKETCVHQPVGLCSTPVLYPRRLVYISLWACAPHRSCTQGDLCTSACAFVLHTSPVPKETCVHQPVGLCSTPVLYPRRLVYISLCVCAPHQSCTQGDLCTSACAFVLHTSPVPKETCVHQPVGLCSTPVLYPRRLVYISLCVCAPHQSCTQGDLCTSACGLVLHTGPVPKETCVHQPVGLCSTPVLYPRRLVYISLWACAPHRSCTQGDLCISACGLVLHTGPVPKETCVYQPVGLCSTPVLYPRRLVYISLWACAPHRSCTQGDLCISACGLVLHTGPVPKETCVYQPVGLCSTPVLYPWRLVYISLWACAPHRSCTQGDLCISACGLVLHTGPVPKETCVYISLWACAPHRSCTQGYIVYTRDNVMFVELNTVKLTHVPGLPKQNA